MAQAELNNKFEDEGWAAKTANLGPGSRWRYGVGTSGPTRLIVFQFGCSRRNRTVLNVGYEPRASPVGLAASVCLLLAMARYPLHYPAVEILYRHRACPRKGLMHGLR